MKRQLSPQPLFPDNVAWEMQRLGEQDLPRLIPRARERLQAYRDDYRNQNITENVESVRRQNRQAKLLMAAGGLVMAMTAVVEYFNGEPVSDNGAIFVGVSAGVAILGYTKRKGLNSEDFLVTSPQVEAIDGYIAQLDERAGLEKGESA